MAQQALLEITLPAVGVDQRTGPAVLDFASHGVDGQVAPLQVLLERDLRRELRLKAAITGRGLAFEARQRIFLARLRVQEHREFPANGAIAKLLELLRGAAD